MAKKKKNTSKKVNVMEILEFPNGVKVTSTGKGKLKGDQVVITEAPLRFTSSEAKVVTIVTLKNGNVVKEVGPDLRIV